MVRKRGVKGELFGVVIFLSLMTYCVRSVEGISQEALIYGGTIVFAFYMGWWSWRTVPWDPVEGEVEQVSRAPDSI
jgi:hypothetical protein